MKQKRLIPIALSLAFSLSAVVFDAPHACAAPRGSAAAQRAAQAAAQRAAVAPKPAPVASQPAAQTQAQQQASIANMYQSILGRAPDAAGLAAWTNSGLSLTQIQAGLSGSQEAANRTAAQQTAAAAATQQAAAAAAAQQKAAQAVAQQAKINAVQNQPGSEQAAVQASAANALAARYAANQQAAAAATLAAQQAAAQLATAQRTAAIDAMYRATLGRAPDAAGLAGWTNSGQTLAQIQAGISGSTEAANFRATSAVQQAAAVQSATQAAAQAATQAAAQRTAAITQMYVTTLGRQPDAAGLAAWSNSQQSLAQIQANISGSQEAANKTAAREASAAASGQSAAQVAAQEAAAAVRAANALPPAQQAAGQLAAAAFKERANLWAASAQRAASSDPAVRALGLQELVVLSLLRAPAVMPTAQSGGGSTTHPAQSTGANTAHPAQSAGGNTAHPAQSAGANTAHPAQSAGANTAHPAQSAGAQSAQTRVVTQELGTRTEVLPAVTSQYDPKTRLMQRWQQQKTFRRYQERTEVSYYAEEKRYPANAAPYTVAVLQWKPLTNWVIKEENMGTSMFLADQMTIPMNAVSMPISAENQSTIYYSDHSTGAVKTTLSGTKVYSALKMKTTLASTSRTNGSAATPYARRIHGQAAKLQNATRSVEIEATRDELDRTNNANRGEATREGSSGNKKVESSNKFKRD